MLLAAAVFEVQRPAEEIDCAICCDQLAPFIDQEIADAQLAVRLYPQVWWHLWTCASCSELYELTRRLIDAERVGLLPPMPIPRPTLSLARAPRGSEPVPLFQLPRDFLSWAFAGQPARPRAGVVEDEHEVVLFEDDITHGLLVHNVQMRVAQIPQQPWRMTITVSPPIAGWFSLTLDDIHRRIHFDPQGVAVIPDLPPDALRAAAGPDLIGHIEPTSDLDVAL